LDEHIHPVNSLQLEEHKLEALQRGHYKPETEPTPVQNNKDEIRSIMQLRITTEHTHPEDIEMYYFIPEKSGLIQLVFLHENWGEYIVLQQNLCYSILHDFVMTGSLCGFLDPHNLKFPRPEPTSTPDYSTNEMMYEVGTLYGLDRAELQKLLLSKANQHHNPGKTNLVIVAWDIDNDQNQIVTHDYSEIYQEVDFPLLILLSLYVRKLKPMCEFWVREYSTSEMYDKMETLNVVSSCQEDIDQAQFGFYETLRINAEALIKKCKDKHFTAFDQLAEACINDLHRTSTDQKFGSKKTMEDKINSWREQGIPDKKLEKPMLPYPFFGYKSQSLIYRVETIKIDGNDVKKAYVNDFEIHDPFIKECIISQDGFLTFSHQQNKLMSNVVIEETRKDTIAADILEELTPNFDTSSLLDYTQIIKTEKADGSGLFDFQYQKSNKGGMDESILSRWISKRGTMTHHHLVRTNAKPSFADGSKDFAKRFFSFVDKDPNEPGFSHNIDENFDKIDELFSLMFKDAAEPYLPFESLFDNSHVKKYSLPFYKQFANSRIGQYLFFLEKMALIINARSKDYTKSNNLGKHFHFDHIPNTHLFIAHYTTSSGAATVMPICFDKPLEMPEFGRFKQVKDDHWYIYKPFVITPDKMENLLTIFSLSLVTYTHFCGKNAINPEQPVTPWLGSAKMAILSILADNANVSDVLIQSRFMFFKTVSSDPNQIVHEIADKFPVSLHNKLAAYCAKIMIDWINSEKNISFDMGRNKIFMGLKTLFNEDICTLSDFTDACYMGNWKFKASPNAYQAALYMVEKILAMMAKSEDAKVFLAEQDPETFDDNYRTIIATKILDNRLDHFQRTGVIHLQDLRKPTIGSETYRKWAFENTPVILDTDDRNAIIDKIKTILPINPESKSMAHILSLDSGGAFLHSRLALELKCLYTMATWRKTTQKHDIYADLRTQTMCQDLSELAKSVISEMTAQEFSTPKKAGVPYIALKENGINIDRKELPQNITMYEMMLSMVYQIPIKFSIKNRQDKEAKDDISITLEKVSEWPLLDINTLIKKCQLNHGHDIFLFIKIQLGSKREISIMDVYARLCMAFTEYLSRKVANYFRSEHISRGHRKMEDLMSTVTNINKLGYTNIYGYSSDDQSKWCQSKWLSTMCGPLFIMSDKKLFGLIGNIMNNHTHKRIHLPIEVIESLEKLSVNIVPTCLTEWNKIQRAYLEFKRTGRQTLSYFNPVTFELTVTSSFQQGLAGIQSSIDHAAAAESFNRICKHYMIRETLYQQQFNEKLTVNPYQEIFVSSDDCSRFAVLQCQHLENGDRLFLQNVVKKTCYYKIAFYKSLSIMTSIPKSIIYTPNPILEYNQIWVFHDRVIENATKLIMLNTRIQYQTGFDKLQEACFSQIESVRDSCGLGITLDMMHMSMRIQMHTLFGKGWLNSYQLYEEYLARTNSKFTLNMPIPTSPAETAKSFNYFKYKYLKKEISGHSANHSIDYHNFMVCNAINSDGKLDPCKIAHLQMGLSIRRMTKSISKLDDILERVCKDHDRDMDRSIYGLVYNQKNARCGFLDLLNGFDSLNMQYDRGDKSNRSFYLTAVYMSIFPCARIRSNVKDGIRHTWVCSLLFAAESMKVLETRPISKETMAILFPYWEHYDAVLSSLTKVEKMAPIFSEAVSIRSAIKSYLEPDAHFEPLHDLAVYWSDNRFPAETIQNFIGGNSPIKETYLNTITAAATPADKVRLYMSINNLKFLVTFKEKTLKILADVHALGESNHPALTYSQNLVFPELAIVNWNNVYSSLLLEIIFSPVKEPMSIWNHYAPLLTEGPMKEFLHHLYNGRTINMSLFDFYFYQEGENIKIIRNVERGALTIILRIRNGEVYEIISPADPESIRCISQIMHDYNLKIADVPCNVAVYSGKISPESKNKNWPLVIMGEPQITIVQSTITHASFASGLFTISTNERQIFSSMEALEAKYIAISNTDIYQELWELPMLNVDLMACKLLFDNKMPTEARPLFARDPGVIMLLQNLKLITNKKQFIKFLIAAENLHKDNLIEAILMATEKDDIGSAIIALDQLSTNSTKIAYIWYQVEICCKNNVSLWLFNLYKSRFAFIERICDLFVVVESDGLLPPPEFTITV
jgi:hypothetical protein